MSIVGERDVVGETRGNEAADHLKKMRLSSVNPQQ